MDMDMDMDIHFDYASALLRAGFGGLTLGEYCY